MSDDVFWCKYNIAEGDGIVVLCLAEEEVLGEVTPRVCILRK